MVDICTAPLDNLSLGITRLDTPRLPHFNEFAKVLNAERAAYIWLEQ